MCLPFLIQAVSQAQAHNFSFNGPDGFLLDGEPFQMLSGEMHPARIPFQYWRHRIRMAKAMGLNTVAIYVFWNQHEVERGVFDFHSPQNNVSRFLELCREEGMWVFLRPGPYVCAEWDLGGLPVYLIRERGARLRSMQNAEYVDAVARYVAALAAQVRPHMH